MHPFFYAKTIRDTVAILYVADILYYTIYDIGWGIGGLNCR
jgi:hypothetical protein